MLHRNTSVALLLAASVGLVIAGQPQQEMLRIQGTSRVVIHVGKAGAFGFAGHAHEVEAPVAGSVTVDRQDPARSEVVVEFDSASLRVSPAGEPPQDVPAVQQVMLSDRVLDANRYPKIVFRSRRITVLKTSGESVGLDIAGDLTLHGVTKPTVVHVRVTMENGAVTATGTATVTQSDFGIQPVTAAGGTIRVKDAVEIAFTVRAAR
jgi:polyisoprenoid-binding protein YceI